MHVTNLLLTGRPGIGKTTVLVEVARRLGEPSPGGFVTEELRQHGQRVGFVLSPFRGEQKTMAHCSLVSSHRVGRYGVDLEVIDYVSDLALSPRAPVTLYLVDEIGKMECLSARFVRAMGRLLDDPRPVVATVAQSGKGLIAEVKQRTDATVWEISGGNRDKMAGLVLGWLKRWIEGSTP